MKKFFTTLLLMGVALCSWATITESSDGTTVTLNYVDDGNSNDQNFSLSNRNATTIVLTGDWANKNLQKIGSIVGQCSGNVFLDMSACSNMVSKVQYTGTGETDWTSNDFMFLPDPNNPETVQRTGTATESAVYYNTWALDGNGKPQSWASPYTGEVQGDEQSGYHTPDNQPLVKFTTYCDENGKQLPDDATITENNGTYSYSYTETLDTTPFSLAGNNFSNQVSKLSGIAFPDHANFTAIPDNVFGESGAQNLASATVGSDLVWIGKAAFKNSQLTEFAFPAGLKVIGGEAFHSAPLTAINLGGCTSLVAIKYEAFEECASATTVTFPSGENFTFLGNDAFNKSGITSIDMSKCDGITEFQANNGKYKTFSNCTALKTVILPPNLAAVPDDSGDGVFYGCGAIETLTFTGTPVYDGCTLTNPCTIGENAFAFNTSLSSITLSKNISYIGYQAFHSAAIEEISIPASMEELAKHSFYGCTKLTTVIFEEFDSQYGTCDGAETKLAGEQGSGGQGQGAFEECQAITDVYINTMAELQCLNNGFDQDITWGAGDAGANFATLHFPKEKTEHYVNLSHYLTDAIVTDPGLFHEWLEDHYDQAINPHKNGWYEFINSGPTVPDGPEYQSIILRTFSDYDYAYLVPQGLRAYVVNKVEKQTSSDNYEVTLQRLNVIPKRTGVILYGHPNGRTQDGKPALVLTPVKFLETGDPLYDQKYVDDVLVDCDIEYNEDGTMVVQDTYRGPDQGAALCRANWGDLDDAHAIYKNYLEPILSADGSRVDIKPYETIKVGNVKKVTFRNFALGRYTSTDYFSKDESTLNDETNFVGFFRMKPQSYKSGYAYLRLTGDVDENGVALTKPEFNVADGGEILVKPDEPTVDLDNHVYPYYYEVMIKDGEPYNARAKVGDETYNPKGWWNDKAEPVAFDWREYTLSWGDRSQALVDPNGSAKYFGEFEEDADGVVKIVIPAGNEDGEYYTLQGVRVTNPTKGVYIQNGKKVVVK